VSFRWQPTQAVLVRGSYSTGFRAPSLYDIHSAQTYTNTAGTYDDPVTCPGGTPLPGHAAAANCNQQFQVLGGGNPALQPEKSKNATLGIMIEPLKGLSVGIDVWALKLDHQISVLSLDDIFADNVTYGSRYHRNPAGELSVDGSQCPNPATCGYILRLNENLGGIITNGIDLSANYRLRTSGWGTFTFASNSTYVHKYEYQNTEGGEWHQNVGVYSGVNPVFRWQSTNNLVWNRDALSAGLTARYKSGYQDQSTEDNPTNHVASYTTFDTFVAWQQAKGLGLTLGVRNLLDRDPPLSYQDYTFQAGYDPRYTDPVGRTFYARVNYTF
jgi:iron complex outermembrane receptor protein